MRKDWNCPWIRRDGKGIKQVLRPTDPVPAPIKTSQNHFYSEPQSILAPEANPEELERLIQERMEMLQQEEELAKQKQQQQQQQQQQLQQQKQQQQQQQKQIHQQKMVIEQQQERLEQNKMEVEFSQQQHVRFEREPSKNIFH